MSQTPGLLQTWMDVARTSRPSRKPQLWEDPLFYARRRLQYILASITKPELLNQPRLIRLRSHGIFIEVLPSRYVGKNMFLYGIWEIVGTRLLELVLRPGMRFVDVGANVGYYSLLAAHLVGPAGVVDSFEPLDAMRSMLEHGVRANGFNNVRIHREAVTASSGSIELYPFSEVNEGVSSTIAGPGVQADAIVVPATTLDDVLLTENPMPRADVIKIDVEGAELHVFEGMRRLLESDAAPGAILFESERVAECAHLLESCGYAVQGTYFSLGRGLEFVDPRDERTTQRLLKDFRGQPTLDYLALNTKRADVSFSSLTNQSRARLSWPWRVLPGLT